jgi:Tol biopolymer transport system component
MRYLLIIALLVTLATKAAAFQILFTNRPSGTDHIYLMNGDGSNVRQLTTTSTTGPMHWSFNGQQIVYEDSSNIWKMNADGTGKTQLTSTNADQFPNFSPDGTKIAYMHVANPATNPTTGYPTTALYTMNSDGTSPAVLLFNGTGSPPVGDLFTSPHYSPDGSKLLYESTFFTNSLKVFVCSMPGCTGQTLLTNITGIAADPEWNSTGTKIVYSSAPASTGNVNVWLMNADGSNQTKITNFVCPIEGADPAWSSDNTLITFEYDTGVDGVHCVGQGNNSAPTSVWTMNADGSNEATTGQACSNIGCSPKYQLGVGSGSNGVQGVGFW